MKRKSDQYQKVLIAIIALYCVFVGAVNPAFLQVTTIFDIVRTASTSVILAIGLLVVMISGGIDVSFMAIALFGSYTTINIMISSGINNFLFAAICSMAFGIVLGAINAALINWLKLPPFIITLGTQNLFHGIMTTFISDKYFGAGVLPTGLHKFGSGTLFKIQTEDGIVGLTLSIVPVILAMSITWFFLNRTMIGRGVIAVGNDEESARRIGFDPNKIRFFVYIWSGILAGLAGIIYVAQINALYPNKMIGGELPIVAAVVIGGTKITGGEGNIFGAILGILIIYILNSTLILIGLSSSWNDLFTGSILVVAIAISSYQERLRNQNNLIFTN